MGPLHPSPRPPAGRTARGPSPAYPAASKGLRVGPSTCSDVSSRSLDAVPRESLHQPLRTVLPDGHRAIPVHLTALRGEGGTAGRVRRPGPTGARGAGSCTYPVVVRDPLHLFEVLRLGQQAQALGVEPATGRVEGLPGVFAQFGAEGVEGDDESSPVGLKLNLQEKKR